MIDAKSMADRARSASFEEAKDVSGGEFRGELAGLLTPEAITQGFRLDFGPDLARFNEVVEILSIRTALLGEAPTAQIHNYIFREGMHTTLLGGLVSSLPAELGLAERLELIHSCQGWRTTDTKDYPLMLPTDSCTAEMIITNPLAGSPASDIKKPAVILGLHRRNVPMVADVGGLPKEDYDTLVGFLSQRKYDPNSTKITELENIIATSGLRLLNPESNYFIAMGLPSMSYGFLSDIDGVNVKPENYHRLVGSNFEHVRINDTEED